ncbi:hypothetical protein [Pseudonocardia dioxanivorans]|jgi:hypothetical protein|uniref:hypothetical protein n=1 Tax=Pseudonocardia dioxanivorans TaxID=240495 RepID=UPI000CD31F6D|nr:hypothetical protein [Pseudonocardia dioxanivorans]
MNPTRDDLTWLPRDCAAAVAKVRTALTALDDEFVAHAYPAYSDAGEAARSARLAMICARRAGWWRVLVRRLRSDRFAPHLFRLAAVEAAQRARTDARFWRDAAADWRARAESRPTSDAAGAMSNHHDLGIAS